MLGTLAIWAVLVIMDLLMSLWPGQELSDPGRRPKSLYQPRVECGPRCPSTPVVSGEKKLLPKCISSKSTLAREQGKGELAEVGPPR